jgi:hypothetical protein
VVLSHHGEPVSVDELDGELPKAPGGGVLSVDLLLLARARGFEARWETGDDQRIAEAVRSGRPVILMLQVLDVPGDAGDYYHYVVVDGFDPGRGFFRFHFGDGRTRWSPMGRGLRRAWRGAGHALLLVEPSPDRRVEARLAQAVAREAAGDAAGAEQMYRAILEEEPRSVRAWTNLGNALAAQGCGPEAEEAYRRALGIDGRDAAALNNLAWLLFERGSLPEAEVLARRATEIEPSDRDLVLDTLGRILLARGDCAEAAATFRQGLDWTPLDRPPARADLLEGLSQSHRDCRQDFRLEP